MTSFTHILEEVALPL